MGYAKPSVTETLFAELLGGPNGRILLDDQGLIHWHDPRNATDARPWTNSHLTRPLSRTLRAVDGPTWPELVKLARRLGATARRNLTVEGNDARYGSHTSGDWGFQVVKWRYGRSDQWRLSASMAHIDEEGKVQRQTLRDTDPSAVLTQAARMGMLGNLQTQFQNGTRFKTGEVWQEQEVKL